MLFVHEVHKVVGKAAAGFESAYRNGWMPILAQGSDARLALYFDLAHGSGLAYRVVTITAVRDGAAWESLAQRMLLGDLSDLTTRLDAERYEVTGKLLTPVYWSSMQELDLDQVPTDGHEHELSVYMQDTGWPDAPLDDYIELWDHDYWHFMRQIPPEEKLLDILACNHELLDIGPPADQCGGARPRDVARDLHDEGLGSARPVGEQAAAYQ